MSKNLARAYKATENDAKERVHVLRLQAMAWRLVAMISLTDQERGRANAQWLLFNTLPFTNGPAVEGFIAENQTLAEDCAVKAGVVTRRTADT